tara:strand:+ start:4825 stop:5499 length:675 start_codon:yes stop_codon:yes gene_type:complete
MKHLLSSTAFLVVNKRLIKRVGLKASVLLADLISKEQYFIDNNMLIDGYFYNTSENIERDTTLSRHMQSVAIKILKDKGFIETKLQGIPATLHFKIFDDKITNFLKTSCQKNTKLDLKKLKTNNNKQIKNKKDIITREQEFTEKVFMSNLSSEVCQDFVDYWTERNKSGTKMKFEMQKTFDIKRRLSRWVKNETKWNTTKTSKIDKQLDSYQKAINIIKNINED